MTANEAVQAQPAENLASASRQHEITNIVLYGLIFFLLTVFGFPLYYMLIVSLMTRFEAFHWPPYLYPVSWQFQNYPEMFTRVPLLLWFRNSAFVALFQVTGVVLSSAIVGYGFARFRFPLRNVLFIITLGTMMFPSQITLIPQFVLFHRLDWINSFYPLIVPPFFGGGAFNIFLMRQFIMQIPRDLDEAALIDGASYLRTFLSVLLPLVKPALATVAVIQFMSSWRAFLRPLIYLQSNKRFTLAIGLRYWDAQPALGEIAYTHLMMAMCVIMTTPPIILFFSAQSIFVRGIVTTGIKG
ncbi:MAG: carbohydrate ABC transporter permease [Halomonas sp.]|uniref:carbohydrate ABC transporter permease n=1 Tax=Halomonas sp. TaxID=1486246 RepID=UPI003970C9BD